MQNLHTQTVTITYAKQNLHTQTVTITYAKHA
jgi:hypothetical protein